MSTGLLSRRTATGLAATFAALILASAPPLASAAGDPPPLTDFVTISGKGGGYAEFTLTQPLRPFDDDEPLVSLHGGGEFVAVALRHIPEHSWYRNTYISFATPDLGQWSTLRASANDWTLYPGRYRLYLFAVDEAVATIQFENLPPGESVVAPDHPAPFWAGNLPFREAEGLVRWGESRELENGGLAMTRLVSNQPVPGAQIELCWYFGSESFAGDRAYDRGCPEGLSSGPWTAPGPGYSVTAVMTGTDDTVADGHGGNVTSAFGSSNLSAFNVWAGFGPTPDPVPPPDDRPPAGETQAGPIVGAPTGPPNASFPQTGSSELMGTATATRSRLVMHRGTVRARLACDQVGPCTGRVGLLDGRATDFALDAGDSQAVPVDIARRLARRVRKRGAMEATLLVNSTRDGEVAQQHLDVRIVSST